MDQFAFPSGDSPWFLPAFALLWIGVTAGLALLSGWTNLAEEFRSEQPVDGERFRFASAAIGARLFPVGYSNCLFLIVGPMGIGVSIFFLFRLLSPPLYIPWARVESVEQRRFLFLKSTVVRVAGHWPELKIYGRAGQHIWQLRQQGGLRLAP
jgi:hypothetical protein